MSNLIRNYFAILAMFAITFLYSMVVLSDDNPEENDREAAWQAEEDSGANDVIGQQCNDYISGKGWQKGLNYKSNGSEFFVAVGISEIKAPTDSRNYITSTMNASINSQLDSKRALVESMSTEISSEIVTKMVQQMSDGTKPDFIGTSEKPASEIKNYEDMSIFEKTKVLVNQQLDKLVDKETKDKIKSDSMSAKQLEDELNDILNQSSFKDKITANASGSVRGMKSVYSAYAVGKGDKQTTVCNVGLWSSKLAADVDAMTTGDYSKLQNLKPGKPLRDYIPYVNKKFNKSKYDSAFKAFESLQGTFGAFMVRNERGEMSVISYAQEKIPTSSAASEINAFNNATLRARRAIIQLRDENIDTVQSMQEQEVTTEDNEGMIDYWSESNSEKRLAASASGTLKGDYELYRWRNKHTLNGQPLAGVVIAWTPSNAQTIDQVSDIMSQSPEPSSSSYSSDYTESTSDSEGGSSAGDDEDDF